jgi:hypothetical protein
MKNIHVLAILGGVAAIAYYATRGTSNAPRQKSLVPGSDAFEIRTDPSGGKICVGTLTGGIIPMRHCTDPASALEGYFSVGAVTGPAVGPYGRGHLHKTPCCSNCANGLSCAG